MKLISLNVWGGKIYEPLMKFIKKYSNNIDIFCFQEVYKSPSNVLTSHGMRMNIYNDIVRALPGHKSFFTSAQDGWDNDAPVDFEVSFGQSTFIKNSIKTDAIEHIFICGEKNSANPGDSTTVPGAMLCARIDSGGKTYSICNIHGAAFPGSKLDTPERIKQSLMIKDFMEKAGERIILCGDFNLMPDTKSMMMLEEKLENLIKKFNISNTRSRLSPYFRSPEEQKFADYILVSSDIAVKDFQVFDDQVSDHLPMYLEFSVKRM